MHQALRCMTFLIVFIAVTCPPLPTQSESPNNKVIRLAVVYTPRDSGLIDFLFEDFKKNTGFSVEVYSGRDVYERAHAGRADIIISHYGIPELERFVLDGFGTWPKIVFSILRSGHGAHNS